MVGNISLLSRLTNANCAARRQVVLRCERKDRPVPLPGKEGGFLLPNPMLVEAGYLYGPGRLGWAMSSRTGPSSRLSMNLVPYDCGDPPVSLDEDSKRISIDLAEGTIYEVDAEPVEDDVSVDLQLAPASRAVGPSIAGLLPAASGDAESVDDTDSESDATQRLFVGGQSSPRRTLGISFTCNNCGARNVRKMNPLAWHSGTVFLQCAGCKVHHKVVDHLNLTEEFNLASGSAEGSGALARAQDISELEKEVRRLDRLSVTRSLMPEKMRFADPQEGSE